MGKCYDFIGSEKHGQYIAKLPADYKLTHDEIINYLLEKNEFPCELELNFTDMECNHETFVWHDYMYNEFAFFMMSKKLMTFFKKRITENDKIDWIPVTIKKSDESRTYYIIKFYGLPDVLDYQNSSYNPITQTLLVPCIALEKAKRFSVFPLRMANGFFPTLLYTTEEFKKEMKKEQFSNLVFEKAKTSKEGILIK